ncbi:hypothetical protein BDK51DRAFT_41733 [Blyttiomyces helicus]|uniref:Uncharacterized protein n=1 Tax=Blyttiomyces helicus TaxID=388810 RepID=A0A4P9WLF0_9FUNG|nr:hypothetical protein BDK51DRAFT_41733 [Blyttiomyces helicus]|eukprot:RKO92438.1 hypothetical protein BDK51DRAFT_41733 [Blyttiomyces helicus]
MSANKQSTEGPCPSVFLTDPLTPQEAVTDPLTHAPTCPDSHFPPLREATPTLGKGLVPRQHRADLSRAQRRYDREASVADSIIYPAQQFKRPAPTYPSAQPPSVDPPLKDSFAPVPQADRELRCAPALRVERRRGANDAWRTVPGEGTAIVTEILPQQSYAARLSDSLQRFYPSRSPFLLAKYGPLSENYLQGGTTLHRFVSSTHGPPRRPTSTSSNPACPIAPSQSPFGTIPSGLRLRNKLVGDGNNIQLKESNDPANSNPLLPVKLASIRLGRRALPPQYKGMHRFRSASFRSVLDNFAPAARPLRGAAHEPTSSFALHVDWGGGHDEQTAGKIFVLFSSPSFYPYAGGVKRVPDSKTVDSISFIRPIALHNPEGDARNRRTLRDIVPDDPKNIVEPEDETDSHRAKLEGGFLAMRAKSWARRLSATA